MSENRHYLSYLLRLWKESSHVPPLWRASLQSPHSEEIHGFSGLEDLFDYLKDQTGEKISKGMSADSRQHGEGDEN